MVNGNFIKIKSFSEKFEINLGDNFILFIVSDTKNLLWLKKVIFNWGGSKGFFGNRRIFVKRGDSIFKKYKILANRLSFAEGYIAKFPEPNSVTSFINFWEKAAELNSDDAFLDNTMSVITVGDKVVSPYSKKNFQRVQIILGVDKRVVIFKDVIHFEQKNSIDYRSEFIKSFTSRVIPYFDFFFLKTYVRIFTFKFLIFWKKKTSFLYAWKVKN